MLYFRNLPLSTLVAHCISDAEMAKAIEKILGTDARVAHMTIVQCSPFSCRILSSEPLVLPGDTEEVSVPLPRQYATHEFGRILQAFINKEARFSPENLEGRTKACDIREAVISGQKVAICWAAWD